MHDVSGRVSEEVADRQGELPAAGGQRAVELLQGRRVPRRERPGRVVLGARLERPQRARPRPQEPRARARTLLVLTADAASCLVRLFEHMLSARLAFFCAQEDVSDPVELLGYYHASSTNEELVQRLKEGELQVPNPVLRTALSLSFSLSLPSPRACSWPRLVPTAPESGRRRDHHCRSGARNGSSAAPVHTLRALRPEGAQVSHRKPRRRLISARWNRI